jgi:MarR family transcriptional regulator, organic hydroperoxide resistance regulator
MGTTRSKVDQLDSEILDAMGELIAALIERSEKIAQRFGVPAFCLKALHLLESSMAMRDLGKFMHCDPSFVTAIADLLEKRGLARREASTADRRIKNLVLTQEGIGLRAKIEREFMAHMPWRSLDEHERRCLLSLIRKMTAADPAAASDTTGTTGTTAAIAINPTTISSTPTGTTPPSTGGKGAGEVSGTLITAQRAD